ncbi:hypothetical protein, partial [Paenibacillus tepidiphilus]|uniref:hypothetical protein n=1 Tax=Paenibacillus tepidiphilus TaxID=2608683 RepID=UPI00193E35A6
KQGNSAALVLRIIGLSESTYYDRMKRMSQSPRLKVGAGDPFRVTPLRSLGRRLATSKSRNGCWN